MGCFDRWFNQCNYLYFIQLKFFFIWFIYLFQFILFITSFYGILAMFLWLCYIFKHIKSNDFLLLNLHSLLHFFVFFNILYWDASVLFSMLSSIRILFWGVYRAPGFLSNLWFYTKIPALYSKIPCYLGFSMWYRARCATGGVGGEVGPLDGVEVSLALYVFLIRHAV